MIRFADLVEEGLVDAEQAAVARRAAQQRRAHSRGPRSAEDAVRLIRNVVERMWSVMTRSRHVGFGVLVVLDVRDARDVL